MADARAVTTDIASSGLTVAASSTLVDTRSLGEYIDKLGTLDVTPTLLIPALTTDASAEAAAAAQAAAQAQAEAEAAAAAKAAKATTAAAAPAVDVNVDPASAQGIARSMTASSYGWGDDQFACLVSLWNKESGWRVNAANGSGAYGIPQALPGSKMASAGADWQTNPATQIAWGLGYISGRYGTPCGAWGHSQSTGWY